jgi:hypothetical protein
MRWSQFLILVSIIILAWASLFVTALNQDQRIRTIVNQHTSTIKTVEDNQHINAAAIKNYIACLITPGTLDPLDTVQQLKLAEQQCFDNAPQVK